MNALPQTALNVTILALDLGTRAGWATIGRGAALAYGTADFTPRKSWTPGQRALHFQAWLADTLAHYGVHQIAYEAVHRHVGTEAAHLYGLLQGLVYMLAERRAIEVIPVGVGAIKKTWTGWGDASKEAMVREACRRGFAPDTDNAADALAILHWALLRECGQGLGDGSLPPRETVLRRKQRRKSCHKPVPSPL